MLRVTVSKAHIASAGILPLSNGTKKESSPCLAWAGPQHTLEGRRVTIALAQQVSQVFEVLRVQLCALNASDLADWSEDD